MLSNLKHAISTFFLYFIQLRTSLVNRQRLRPDSGLFFFPVFSAFLWTETRQKKKEQGQYAVTLTEQAWTVKDLLHGIMNTIF